jgi:hypothetical protein
MTEPRRTGRSRSLAAASMEAAGGEDRMAELEARLARLERRPGVRERGRSLMDRVMPPEASGHFRNAGREHLLGMRSIVDFWIARLDDADERAAGRSRERETIEIE